MSYNVDNSGLFKKPPSGLRPRIIADHMRAIEITQAITRALEDAQIKAVPVEWAEELIEIIARHQPEG